MSPAPFTFSFLLFFHLFNPLSDRQRWDVSTDVFKFGRQGDKCSSEHS